jgi:hypothetical protein
MMLEGKADQRSEIGRSSEKKFEGSDLELEKRRQEWGRGEAQSRKLNSTDLVKKWPNQPAFRFRDSSEKSQEMDVDIVDALTDKFVSSCVSDESQFEDVIRAVRNRLFVKLKNE